MKVTILFELERRRLDGWPSGVLAAGGRDAREPAGAGRRRSLNRKS